MFLTNNKDQGLNFNVSFVGNNKDGYTGGTHLTTSDGIDASYEAKGENLDTFLQELMGGLIKNTLDSVAKDAKKNTEEDKVNKVYELENKLDHIAGEINNAHNDISKIEEHINNLECEYEAIEDELYELTDEEEKEEETTVTLDDVLKFDGDFLNYLRDNFNIS